MATAFSNIFLEKNGLIRQCFSATVAINSTIGGCDPIRMVHLADAAILIPTGVTAIAFWGCATEAGTYKAIYGNDVQAASLTVTEDRFYTFPTACFPFPFVKIVSTSANGAATVVAKS